ncbi:MAG TPA: nuclear transport factor 2 family protein [Acidimicrobiia bacterium]|jgi:hypothetical protein
MPAPTDVPEIIERYFQVAVDRDRERYFAIFADDATVEDEGHEHHGIEAIRAWRSSVPDVVYTITDLEEIGGATVVTAEISGDFPGSPVTLTFSFEEYDDVHVRSLRIRA